MKKTLLLSFLLLAFMMTSVGQNKKVAVMETKVNEGVSSFQSNMVRGGMETAVANAPGYEGYDRAAFDVIMKEQNFQRSGAVDEGQITKLGQMAGVQFVLVTEASAEDGYFYLLAKLLDVETGRFVRSAEKLCLANPTDINKACNELGGLLFSAEIVENVQVGETGEKKDKPSAIQDCPSEKIVIDLGSVSFEMVKVSSGGNDNTNVIGNKAGSQIAMGYFIGVYEVTQEVWQAVMGDNPSKNRGYGLPVENVSQTRIINEFIPALNLMTGKVFRLPTESEWEYAAKGGNRSKAYIYSGSNDIHSVAWQGTKKTCVVGQMQPNELGIYDMSGNVWEWCDQKGVVKGGSWRSSEHSCRIYSRETNGSGMRRDDYGFRLVLVPNVIY